MPRPTRTTSADIRKQMTAARKSAAAQRTPVTPLTCDVVPVGKRRDGGTRYWCLRHKANATAKYGKPAPKCRYADVAPVSDAETLRLNIDDYRGGVALWGAVPPIYDTTCLPLDRGIHVHARPNAGRDKTIDRTFRQVHLYGGVVAPGDCLTVTELDAIYCMVTSVFGYDLRYIPCGYCSHSHLDKDWFAVHPHRRHLCAACGKNFRDSETGIGNPIAQIRSTFSGHRQQRSIRSPAVLELRQSDYQGGIQIWGSNPALLWTGNQPEQEGIHVHAFKSDGDDKPAKDDTYARVVIDGVRLDPAMVRIMMAQTALPHIEDRVVALWCRKCSNPIFETGEDAFTPKVEHSCTRCATMTSSTGRLRKTIANPIVAVLADLARTAPRPLQLHRLGLLPETL